MGGVEVGGRWQSYLADQRDTAAQAAAKKVEREAMEARKAAAYAQATAAIARVGARENRRGMTQEQRTPLVPLGPLGEADEQGRSHGFATVLVDRDIQMHEEVTKGLFFKKVTRIPEVTDVVSRFGVVLYAGHEDGGNAEAFDWATWSITDRGFEMEEDMAKLEDLLQQVTTALPGGGAGFTQQ